MHRYFFVLGRNPALSFAEIISLLNKSQIHFDPQVISQEILIISTSLPIDALYIMKTLGGTVKIGEIINEVHLDESESKFHQIFTADNLLSRYFPPKNGKLHLGISLYNGRGDINYFSFLFKQLSDLNIKVKQNLQQVGKKIGFVRIKEKALSSVSVYKNQLLDKGAEIVVILAPTSILVGKTLMVQEFAQFKLRDYDRPRKDKRSGILPPKLARMMINLVGVPTSAVILDPFCGSGTILQEAIILGYKNIIGSDINYKAITDTKTNLNWLFKNFSLPDKSSYNIKLFQTDIKKLNQHFSVNSIDAAVTEPYLGPPLFKKPSLSTIKKILSEVGILYLNTFSQLAKILKSSGKVVIIFPAFWGDGKLHFVDILDKIKQLGFRQIDFFAKRNFNLNLVELAERGSILYGNKEQFVIREILSFEKSDNLV